MPQESLHLQLCALHTFEGFHYVHGILKFNGAFDMRSLMADQKLPHNPFHMEVHPTVRALGSHKHGEARRATHSNSSCDPFPFCVNAHAKRSSTVIQADRICRPTRFDHGPVRFGSIQCQPSGGTKLHVINFQDRIRCGNRGVFARVPPPGWRPPARHPGLRDSLLRMEGSN